jgi:hypothetical protein
VAAVLGQLAQQVQVDPAQRQRAAPVAVHDIVQGQRGGRAPGGLARLSVGLADGVDAVGVVEDERRVGGPRDADLAARAAGERLVEPHLLHEGHVLDQPEQRGPGRHQPPPGLLLGETVEAAEQHRPVLVEEHLELVAQRRGDDVFGGGHGRQHVTGGSVG